MNLTRRHMIAFSLAMLTPAARADEVPLIFAAASLKTVLDEIAREIPMRLNYAGSGVLARQITLGAPADIFISANPQWMAAVTDRLDGPVIPLLGNSLVLIGAEPGLVDLPDLKGAGRIAMGLTEAVPAGQYGKAAFQSLGLWSDLAGQVVQTENVRAAMALVSRGEVPFGVVYKTDALADSNVHILAEFPAQTHPEIIYEAGLIKGSSARGTLQLLVGHPAFSQFGFVPL